MKFVLHNLFRYRIIFLFVSILLIASWFYWFQGRSTETNQACDRIPMDAVKETGPDIYADKDKVYDTVYENCEQIKSNIVQ